jgi:hypothetical protein
LVKAQAVADAAVSLLSMGKIPYVLGGESPAHGMDCEGLVQWCVRTAGGESDYSGSNDMWRHDVEWSGTIEQAQSQGKLLPGSALFVVFQNGKEPPKYQGDGYGNAQHCGVYCGAPNAECVSASSVKMMVGTTTLQQGWTHAAWLKQVDYSPSTTTVPTPPVPYSAKVVTQNGGRLNLRRAPTMEVDNRVGYAPNGATLEVIDDAGTPDWSRVQYQGITAWAKSEFLQPIQPQSESSEQEEITA